MTRKGKICSAKESSVNHNERKDGQGLADRVLVRDLGDLGSSCCSFTDCMSVI